MWEIDTLQRAASATLGIATPLIGMIGAIGALAKSLYDHVYQSRLHSKAEIEPLSERANKVDDKPYQKFLSDIAKEKLSAYAFGCRVRNGELGALMTYYDQGGATIGEIRLAWPYRVENSVPLTFRFSWTDYSILVLIHGYAILCGCLALMCLLLAVLLPDWSSKAIFLGLVFGMSFLIALWYRMNLGRLIAARLSTGETSPILASLKKGYASAAKALAMAPRLINGSELVLRGRPRAR